jgi:HD-GYP domain-containing protein (c-di-GMP phosphodiesterase class II)
MPKKKRRKPKRAARPKKSRTPQKPRRAKTPPKTVQRKPARSAVPSRKPRPAPRRGPRTITRSGYTAHAGRAAVGEMARRMGDISRLRDLDSLLEKILSEARRFTRADAGTIYLQARGRLHFNFVQNDTLFRNRGAAARQLFLKSVLPINRNSIAGYVAQTGKTLLVGDAHRSGKIAGHSYNPALDRLSGYRTRSVLAVPVIARNDAVLGVLELVNALDRRGRPAPFSAEDTLYVSQLAANAGYAIENARLTREMAFRMVEMAALRDPSETAAHAERVSAIASRLYLAWARKHGVEPKERRATRESLRLAAILHDVGKVAVSDAVLRKPGRLTPGERHLVRCHTVYGARLFLNTSSPWDRAAAEVALNHHEQWNGGGYPGKLKNLRAREIEFGPGKKGREIPLLARIVSIADVYDSLVSKRVYKQPWTEEEARSFIRSKSGVVFDPELTELFLGMRKTVGAIEARFRKKGK